MSAYDIIIRTGADGGTLRRACPECAATTSGF